MCEVRTTPARGLKSLGTQESPQQRGLEEGPREWLWKRKKWVCPMTACSQPGSHPELTPRQNERRSGNQRRQPSLPVSGCVTPRRKKCQKWGENQQDHNYTWLLCLRGRHGRAEGAAMPPSLRGCLLSAVLRLPVALTPQSSFQAASLPKSHLKGMKLEQDTPFWPEGKQSKSTSAPLLLMAHRASPWEQAASGRGRSSLYPVAAILPLGNSKPVPSCSQNQQGLCCPQQSWGCRHKGSCTDCVGQPHFQPPPSTRMCGAH